MQLIPVLQLLASLLSPIEEERIVFMVDPYHDESGWYAEPIVYIRGSKFVEVVNSSDTSFEPYKKFTGTYFRIGKQYPVYHNDERLGEMTVISTDSVFACMQITAQVQVKYSGKQVITLGEPGLAFSGLRPKKTLVSRMTAKEDSVLAMKLAMQDLKGRKLHKSALSKVQLNRIRAVDLDDDAQPELIATFETNRMIYSKELKMEINMIYFLALVIDNGEVVYNYYTSGAEEGDSQGNFASRSDIAGVSDLDADGIAEIIFRNFYYEAWDYTIVNKRANKWQKAWQGGGGGC